MAAAIVFWHTPRWYDLALKSSAWHGVEHACFFYGALLFWSPVIGIWPNRPHWSRWMMIPYLILADVVNTALSAWLVFSTHVVYSTYEMAPRVGGYVRAGRSIHRWRHHVGAWIDRFLIPALILTMQAINGDQRKDRRLVRIKPAARPRLTNGWICFACRSSARFCAIDTFGAFFRPSYSRLPSRSSSMALPGPQIAPMNLAGILPWTYWRGFAVIALLAAGNLFCMACPFTLARDMGRRILPGGCAGRRRCAPSGSRSRCSSSTCGPTKPSACGTARGGRPGSWSATSLPRS